MRWTREEAREMGRKGGSVRGSTRKAVAASKNGRKGGRPKLTIKNDTYDKLDPNLTGNDMKHVPKNDPYPTKLTDTQGVNDPIVYDNIPGLTPEVVARCDGTASR